MKICVIDYKTNEQWNKKWETLSQVDISVLNYNANDLSLTLKNCNPILVIVHESCVDSERYYEFLENYCYFDDKFRPYTMFVSTDKLTGNTGNTGMVHYSKIPMLNNTSLTHLKEPIKALYESLKVACCPVKDDTEKKVDQRKAAWEIWDNFSASTPILHSLSILCQGYIEFHNIKEEVKEADWFTKPFVHNSASEFNIEHFYGVLDAECKGTDSNLIKKLYDDYIIIEVVKTALEKINDILGKNA